ncbi:MAG: hypothetical protein B7Z12_18665, partial [Caulobacter vibrioides]
AIPFFVLAIILEILLGRFGKGKANYEARDTAMSLSMGERAMRSQTGLISITGSKQSKRHSPVSA